MLKLYFQNKNIELETCFDKCEQAWMMLKMIVMKHRELGTPLDNKRFQKAVVKILGVEDELMEKLRSIYCAGDLEND